MYRWSPLNDRQLALLTRIGEGTDPVTSESPELANTARAIKGRGFITMPRRGGKWQAEITDDGRFYLEHGHHPDRPEPAPRKQRPVAAEPKPEAAAPPRRRATLPPEAKPAPARPAKPPRQSPAEIGSALIAEVQKAGRFLRIPDPSTEERARYRRAFDAARQCAPEGYDLKYSGRAKGDFFLGLLRDGAGAARGSQGTARSDVLPPPDRRLLPRRPSRQGGPDSGPSGGSGSDPRRAEQVIEDPAFAALTAALAEAEAAGHDPERLLQQVADQRAPGRRASPRTGSDLAYPALQCLADTERTSPRSTGPQHGTGRQRPNAPDHTAAATLAQ